ncbi:hypothetical protein D3OALGA1CA_4466 [Olavius algarvensis associated proteobacterium Delta 3]|nr:hypothetical protein D3OALGB2SA_3655 [Olavius algarvensis associated proteobacterium Delta 3]CAB5151734.1 hypothetical protein D3OALGA1CA_4466 [Olavius algarvensis associated proteobacterium Delta 3]
MQMAIPRPVRIILLPVTGLVVLGVLLWGTAPGGLELWLTPVTGGAPLLVLPLEPGERFTLHYYHSVENAPIWEEHSLDKDGRIYIEEERYLKYGAGMGKMPGVGKMVRRGPYEVIENMHMPTGDFILRVGSPGVDHTILWRGFRTNLSRIAPHKAVQFNGRPVSLLHRHWRGWFPHPATPGKDAA